MGIGRCADAFPANHPMRSATPTMQIASTALSAVPNVDIAKFLSHDGERSMTTPPIAEMADGTAVDHPAKNSVRPRLTATPATPAHPDLRRAILRVADSVTAPLKSVRVAFVVFLR